MSIIRITGGVHKTEIEKGWTVYTDNFEANAGRFSHFTADGETNFGTPQKAEVSDNAFVPIIKPISGNFSDYNIIIPNTGEYWPLGEILDKDLRNQISHEIKFTSDKNIINVKFRADKGNSNANDSDSGHITVSFFGGREKKFLYRKTIENIRYGDEFSIEWNKADNIKQIQFYANDNDVFFNGGIENVFCGAMKIYSPCFCDEEFTVEEFRNIVINLRKKELIDNKISLYDNPKIKDLLFVNQTEIRRVESLSSNDSTYKKVVDIINKVMDKYDIKTCIRKIHFIAQIYHESHRFRATFEGRTEANTPNNYKGGYHFQGRGVKQITHDYNYLEYYDYVNGTSLFKEIYDKNKNIGEGVTELINRIKNDKLNKEFLNYKLIPFAKKLSTDLFHSFDSAGWYWETRNLNILADKDDILAVSRKVNGAVNGIPNGYKERELYTKILKEYFKYEKCISFNK